MGALPKRRISSGRRGRRRSADKISLPKLTLCPACEQSKLSHVACPNCGEYKGRQTKKIIIEKDSEKKEKSGQKTKTMKKS